MEISEGDKRGIFWVHCDPCSTLSQSSYLFVPQHVQLGMTLNYAEKMRAEALIPWQTLIRKLVSKFAMPLRTLGFNDQQDAGFSLDCSIPTDDPRLATIHQMLHHHHGSTDHLVQGHCATRPSMEEVGATTTYKLLVDMLTMHPNCLKAVTHGPAAIAPIDLVMMVLLVFEFQDKLLASHLADVLHALRMEARDKTKDLVWKSKHMGYYLVFLDRLERLGGAGFPSSGRVKVPRVRLPSYPCWRPRPCEQA